MIKFDNLDDVLSYESNCFLCKKKLQNFVASGKYEDILNFGHKTKSLDFKVLKKSLKVTRKLEIEGNEISIFYEVDRKTNKVNVTFLPSIDELVEKFPVAQGFYELDEARYQFAQDNGIINIWRIVNRSLEPLFFVQACEGHYKRITGLFFEQDGTSIGALECYDEFTYVPVTGTDKEVYALCDHHPVNSKKGSRTIFIQKILIDQIDNVDHTRGGVFLREPQDTHLMKFDFSDSEKLSRKIKMLCALKG